MQRVSVLGLTKCLLIVDELNRYIIGNEIYDCLLFIKSWYSHSINTFFIVYCMNCPTTIVGCKYIQVASLQPWQTSRYCSLSQN